MLEIERKFRVRLLPDLSLLPCKRIEQGYLCTKPTIRVRKSNTDYILTYKSNLGMVQDAETNACVNTEFEVMLTEEAYDKLIQKVENNIVKKTRYLCSLDNYLTAEIDVFESFLSGFVMVEVEFETIEAANTFIPPDWFGEELTKDKRFSNYSLSKLMNTDTILNTDKAE